MPELKPQLPGDPLEERRRRRRERIIIALVSLVVIGLTLAEVHLVRRRGESALESLLAFALVNLNTILLLLLAFLIFRNLVKLILERRRRIFGSRLRVRLVLTFVFLALLPTVLMSLIAFELISSRTEYQLGPPVNRALTNALILSRSYYEGMNRKVLVCGQLISRLLAEQRLLEQEPATLQAFLQHQLTEYRLTALEVITATGQVAAAAYDPDVPKESVTPEILAGLRQATATPVAAQANDGGLILRGLMPLTPKPGGEPTFWLVVSQTIPQPLLQQLAELQQGLSEIRRLQYLLRPVRISHLVALGAVTLLVLMSAVWLGMYMAKEITTPIRQLAEGTLKVADGDYNIKIELEGRDEIGFLVQSFNKMTQDLQQSRAQLDAAHRQLSQQNQELEARRRYMEIILTNVAAGVIAIDARDLVTTINRSAENIFGLRAAEALGQPLTRLLPASEANKLTEILATARRSGAGKTQKLLQLARPDRTLTLLVKPTVLKDEQNRYLGMVLVCEDMTELYRAQRLAAWREVAQRIAHEVKNPLTPIQLAAQRLWRRYADKLGAEGELLRECTQMIVNQVEELKNLVNEFSRFARLPKLELQPESLPRLVHEALLLYQESEPAVEFVQEFAPDLPEVWVDREQLKRVLANLVDNALTSCGHQGRITLRAYREPDRERVRLEVSDEGPGIPDQQKEQIFEPYFSTKPGGFGLGLAIARAIVSEHHGRIWVEDNYPRGSRFIIELPLTPAPEIPATQPAPVLRSGQAT